MGRDRGRGTCKVKRWKLEIRPAAKRDFDEAADWYRDRDRELRNRFTGAIRTALSAIRQRPLSYPVVFGNEVRRVVVDRFPYSIFYKMKGDTILVIAIFHQSRNPIIWTGRIDW